MFVVEKKFGYDIGIICSKILRCDVRFAFQALMFLVVFVPDPSGAQVSVQQALSFGEFLMTNNNAQHDITVNPDGTYSYDAAYVEIVAPQRGEYLFTGMAPSTAITGVTVAQDTPLMNGARNFQMVNFQVIRPGSTDPAGEALIFLGATARSSGSTGAYPDQTYTGVIDIVINF